MIAVWVYARQQPSDGGRELWFKWPYAVQLPQVPRLDIEIIWSDGPDNEPIAVSVIQWCLNMHPSSGAFGRVYVRGTVHALGDYKRAALLSEMALAGFEVVDGPGR